MKHQGQSFWVSYSDLATGLMMVFILITCMLALQQVRAIKKTEAQLQSLVKDVTDLAKLRLELAQILQERVGGLDGVTVDEVTARVTVQHSALGFGSQETELGSEGTLFLRQFIPGYACALAEFEQHSCEGDAECARRMDPRRRRGIRRILVTGHADLEGSTIINHAYAVQRSKNVVARSLMEPGSCPTLPNLDLGAYLEARLQPASGGEIGHCLSESGGDSSIRCSTLPDQSAPEHRTVTFEVELVGEDVSGIAINLVALDAVVSRGQVTSGLVETLRPRIEQCARANQEDPECAGLTPGSEALRQSDSLRDLLAEACRTTDSPGFYCVGLE